MWFSFCALCLFSSGIRVIWLYRLSLEGFLPFVIVKYLEGPCFPLRVCWNSAMNHQVLGLSLLADILIVFQSCYLFLIILGFYIFWFNFGNPFLLEFPIF
jgi:hypothetical protein